MPLVPGQGNIRSEGYAVARRILVQRGLPKARGLYVLLHETGHHVRLTAGQMRDLMLLQDPPVKGLPEGDLDDQAKARVRDAWAGELYLWRPREAFPDDFVVHYTKPELASPFRDWYKRGTPKRKAGRYRDIVERTHDPDDPPVVIPDPPEPLPPPLPPIEGLALELAQAQATIDDQAQLIAHQSDQIALAVRALMVPPPDGTEGDDDEDDDAPDADVPA